MNKCRDCNFRRVNEYRPRDIVCGIQVVIVVVVVVVMVVVVVAVVVVVEMWV